MIKFFNLFIINIILFLNNYCLCYEVPSVQLDLLDNGFSLTLPDEPGVKQVFYVIKVNSECPPLMDLIFEYRNQWTTTQLSKALKAQDSLNISLLVNHQGEVHTSYQYIVVGETIRGIKVPPPVIKKRNGANNCGRTMSHAKCKTSPTVVAGITPYCQGQLIFEDNFTDTLLNMKKWSYDIRHRLIGSESEEFIVFDNNSDNLFIHDGYLNIRPTVTRENMRQAKLDFGVRCTPLLNRENECQLMPSSPFIFVPPFNSSQINTRQTFKFQYGRIEIMAKLPKGQWILPYLMLQPSNVTNEKQIRIAFARGNEHLLTTDNIDLSGKILYAGTVTDVETYKNNFKQKVSTEHYGNNFHNYTLIWQENEISMAVDGVEYGTITEDLEGFNEHFFLTLGVSVGGHFEFPDNLLEPTNKPWQNTSPRSIQHLWQHINSVQSIWSGNETLQVDYVKVYAI